MDNQLKPVTSLKNTQALKLTLLKYFKYCLHLFCFITIAIFKSKKGILFFKILEIAAIILSMCICIYGVHYTVDINVLSLKDIFEMIEINCFIKSIHIIHIICIWLLKTTLNTALNETRTLILLDMKIFHWRFFHYNFTIILSYPIICLGSVTSELWLSRLVRIF